MKQFRGHVDDNVHESFGIASEIADVVVRITNESDGSVRELRNFTRRGTRADYDVPVFIEDFEPGPYQAVVIAVDAWGHSSTTDPYSFTVSPF